MKSFIKSYAPNLPKKSRLILTGSHHLFVENYDKILKFESDAVLLLVGKRRILISGKNLWLERYDKFDLLIKGNIYSIMYPENTL